MKLVSEFEDIGIFFDLDNVRLHCGLTNDILNREQSEFKEQFDKKITELQGAAKNHYAEWQADNHFYLFDVFPSLQWLSIFNTAYTIFEKNLNYICTLAARKLKSKIKLSDLNGQGIERSKLYLTKIADITEPFNSPQWQKIKEYAELRNVLVHAAGELNLSKKNHKKVLAFAENHQHINVIRHSADTEFPEIRLEPEVVFESIQEYRDFLFILAQTDLSIIY